MGLLPLFRICYGGQKSPPPSSELMVVLMNSSIVNFCISGSSRSVLPLRSSPNHGAWAGSVEGSFASSRSSATVSARTPRTELFPNQ